MFECDLATIQSNVFIGNFYSPLSITFWISANNFQGLSFIKLLQFLFKNAICLIDNDNRMRVNKQYDILRNVFWANKIDCPNACGLFFRIDLWMAIGVCLFTSVFGQHNTRYNLDWLFFLGKYLLIRCEWDIWWKKCRRVWI